MSQRGGRPIDFQAWAQNQIVKRAVAALEARDEAFAERNADTPLPQLARYLSRCAISLGHSPSPSEVDGGTFIEQRFGSWAAAMAAARLPQPRSMRKLRDTARYKAEKVKQEPLFREERRQKRQRKLEQSEQRKREQAAKKRAERAAKVRSARITDGEDGSNGTIKLNLPVGIDLTSLSPEVDYAGEGFAKVKSKSRKN